MNTKCDDIVITLRAAVGRKKRRITCGLTALLVVGPLLGSPGRLSAQTTVSNDELLRRIGALEAEIAALRAMVEHRPAEATNTEVAADQKVFLDYLHDLKFGTTLDMYYAYNLNQPIGRVNLLRAYDVTSNNFSLNQAAVLIESAPDLAAGRRFGGRLDLQYGQATETLQGSLANEPRPWVYRNVFQAYGTYIAPLGSGITIDFGKWASALGLEGNYTKDQINYSRSYFFNFLPFYHMGARLSYQFNNAVALNYWITNGTEQTEAFNNFKDQFVGLTLQPVKALTWNVQYYLGQEHPDVLLQSTQAPGTPSLPTQAGLSIVPVQPYFAGKLNIFDSYATWHATPTTTFALEADYVNSQNPAPAPASWVFGGVAYLRQQISSKAAIAARGELLNDRGGLFSGQTRRLGEVTATYDCRLSEGFLVRTEWRHDLSSTPLFFTSDPGVVKTWQATATIGVVWWWGTKRGSW